MGHRFAANAVTHGYRMRFNQDCDFRGGVCSLPCQPQIKGVRLHVLFVCTGNICRSPTAERLAAAYGARLQIPDFQASSAGTRAMVGHPIHQHAAHVLEELGGVATDFAARQLTPRMASNADIVIAMTRGHRDAVLELAPHRLHRTFTLSEASELAAKYNAQDIADLAALRSHLAADEALDIPDPIGQSPEFFATIGAQIAGLLAPVLELCRPRSARTTD